VVSGAISVGDVLGGKYVIEAELGAGAMGLVFRGRHRDLNKLVAIKTLRADIADNPELLGRFEQEARAASAIGHPNIVAVFDLGTSDSGARYMVMEHLEGQSLGELLSATPVVATDRAVRMMSQVLSALAAAHRRGIVHRDLKPENIFVTHTDENPELVKLLDFGISKILEIADPNIAGADSAAPRTQFGSILGTPLYMSPEQARGVTDIDHRADLWASGCVLYEMLCGRPPFDGGNYNQILHNILSSKPVPPRQLCPTLPAAVDQVIARALCNDRDARYASAKAMRDELQASLAKAPGYRDFSPMPTPPPRKPDALDGTGLGASALAAAAAGPSDQDAALASALDKLDENALAMGVSAQPPAREPARSQSPAAPQPLPASADAFAPPQERERDLALDVAFDTPAVAPARPHRNREQPTPAPRRSAAAVSATTRRGGGDVFKLMAVLVVLGGVGVAGFMLYKQRKVITGPEKTTTRVSVQLPKGAEIAMYVDGKLVRDTGFDARLGQRYVIELRAKYHLTRRIEVIGKQGLAPIAVTRLPLVYLPLARGLEPTKAVATKPTAATTTSAAALDRAFEALRLYRSCAVPVRSALRKTADSYARVTRSEIRRMRVKAIVPLTDDVVDACRGAIARANDRGGFPTIAKAANDLVDSAGQLNRLTKYLAAYYGGDRYQKDRGRLGIKSHRRLERLLRTSRAQQAVFEATARARLIALRGDELAGGPGKKDRAHHALRAVLYASLQWLWAEIGAGDEQARKSRAAAVIAARAAVSELKTKSPNALAAIAGTPALLERLDAVVELAKTADAGKTIDVNRARELHNRAVTSFNGLIL